MLAEAKYKLAAEDLYQIARKLLEANESMVKWLNRFLYSDFKSADARSNFLKLLKQYNDKKAAPKGFSEMKWPCADIEYIYDQRLESQFGDLLPSNT